jgi:regulator of RNase E activity RraA
MTLDCFVSGRADDDNFVAKPWAVDIPLQIGDLQVKPGDILVADEGEMACCVIPRDKLDAVMELLPTQKEADDGFYNDIKNGMDIKSSLKRWPKHYSISDPVPIK